MTVGYDCINDATYGLSGHDCNAFGIIYPRQCKYGEYSDQTNFGECLACPADEYCQANALTAGTACPNGYVCATNTTVEFPNFLYSEETRYYLCPLGSFCDNDETTTENTCPEGTFMPRYGAEVTGDCVTCPSGYYCPAAGTTIPDLCPTGQYCAAGSGDPGGSLSTKPTDCDAGFYCP